MRLCSVALLALISTTGCRHTVEPFDLNYDETPVFQKLQTGSMKEVSIRGVSVDWDSNAVGDVARKNGFETLHYADLEVFSLSLFGFGWSQETLHLYGE